MGGLYIGDGPSGAVLRRDPPAGDSCQTGERGPPTRKLAASLARSRRGATAPHFLYGVVAMIVHQLLHHRGVRQGSDVPQLLVLAGGDLAQDAAHDLARPRLGQAGDDLDAVRRGNGADGVPHLLLEHAHELLRVGALVLRRRVDVGVDPRPLDVVGEAHHRRLAHRVVGYQGALDLRRPQPVAGDVQHVVHAAGDPVVAVLVAPAAVAGEVEAGV